MTIKHYGIEEVPYEEKGIWYKTGDGQTYRTKEEAESRVQELKDMRTEDSFVTMKINIPLSEAGIDETWTYVANEEILDYFVRLAAKGLRYSHESLDIKSLDGTGTLRVGDWVSKTYWTEYDFGETSERYDELWTLEYFKSHFLVKTMLRVNRILADGEFE